MAEIVVMGGGLCGMASALLLARDGHTVAVALAAAWDADTIENLQPWHEATLQTDRLRFREMEAAIRGVSPDPVPPVVDAFGRAAAHDADVFRSFLEIRQVLALPSKVFGRAGFLDRVLEVAAGRQVMSPLGPTRQELLDLIA